MAKQEGIEIWRQIGDNEKYLLCGDMTETVGSECCCTTRTKCVWKRFVVGARLGLSLKEIV